MTKCAPASLLLTALGLAPLGMACGPGDMTRYTPSAFADDDKTKVAYAEVFYDGKGACASPVGPCTDLSRSAKRHRVYVSDVVDGAFGKGERIAQFDGGFTGDMFYLRSRGLFVLSHLGGRTDIVREEDGSRITLDIDKPGGTGYGTPSRDGSTIAAWFVKPDSNDLFVGFYSTEDGRKLGESPIPVLPRQALWTDDGRYLVQGTLEVEGFMWAIYELSPDRSPQLATVDKCYLDPTRSGRFLDETRQLPYSPESLPASLETVTETHCYFGYEPTSE